MGIETPQRPRKEAAGSRHEPGLVRQTAPASTDPIGPQTQTLLEEVLRRENLRTALKRVQSKWSHWDSRLRVRARPPPPGEATGGTRGPRTCMRP